MIKKLLFSMVALTIAVSAIASAFVAPIVATENEPTAIKDLHWWSNVSDITPGTEFLLAPDINALSSSNSFTLAEDSIAYGLTIPASKDTAIGYCANWGPDANNGDKISFVAWNNSPTADLNSLIEFGLESLPTNAEIYQASLALYAFNYDGYSNIPVGVYKQLHTDWEELQATYNIYKTGSSWTTQGGDYVTSDPAGVVMMIPAASQGWVQWDILDIVNDARNRGIPVELLIKATVHGNAHSDAGFCSKEYYQDTWLQPKLLIGYTLPTPSTPTPTPTPAEPWSFAIITDLHIGEDDSDNDFGYSGWNDSGSYGSNEDLRNQQLQNLITSVLKINERANSDNIKFVAVLGDLTSSAELSEMQAAIDVLNTLSVPWVPVIGNHDIWPYTGDTEAPYPTANGDGPDIHFNDYFNSNMWNDVYQNFADDLGLPSTWKEPIPVLNPTTNPNFYSYFQNFEFDYEGFLFIGLDFNTRNHAPFIPWPGNRNPGIGPEGDLHIFEGGTWNWFTQHLYNYVSNVENGKNVIILSHHPFEGPYTGTVKGDLEEEATGFSAGEKDTIARTLWFYKDHLAMQFSGHHHPGDNGSVLGINTGPLSERTAIRKWVIFRQPYPPQINFVMPCVTIPGNLNVPWVQIVKLDPNDKTNVNYDEDIMNGIIYEAACPVDLVVTDPDNLVISKDINQIPGAMYIDKEYDEYGNSSPCNMIWIPDRKLGNYSIQVIPWSTANDSDTFTLTASPSEDKWGYTPIVLAQNVTVSDIPAEPYTFEVKQRTATNISYTGDVGGYNSDTINLTAVLSTEDGGLLSGKTINFMIGNQSASAVTDVNGVATASLTLNQTPSDFYYVEYSFDGDKDYLPCYDAQQFVIPPLADASGPYTGTEGSPITLSGSGTYDPEGRAISYEWDLDNDGVYDDATGVTPAYTWNDDYADYISLRVTDGVGAISTATTTVTVANVPPTVAAGADINNAIAGTAVNFNGSFTDPGTLDTHTIEWDFDDSSPTVNGILTPTHIYTSSGNYTVTLTVTDDDGGVGTDTLTVNVMPITTTYTFTSGGNTNKWGSAGHIHLIDWCNGHPHSPADFSASPTYGFVSGGSTEYAQISSSDNVRWKSSISHNLGCCSFDRNAELFTFKIAENPSTITAIQIKWEGHGTTGESIYYTTEKLWNASSNSWSTLNNQKNITSDVAWTNNISSNCSNYIDATGNLSVLMSAQRSGLPNNCGIWTDYIEVTVTH